MSDDTPGDLYMIDKTVKSTDICVGIVKSEKVWTSIYHVIIK